MTTPFEYCRDHDQFAAANGIELLTMIPGRATARMTVAERQQNSIGTAHGGSLFTLAATTFFAACNAGGQLALGTNMSITCLKAVASGTLQAEATETARTRKLAHGSVRITDETGDLVAIFQGTAFIKGTPYPPPAKTPLQS
jgi:acyl-CoA thioesterase